MKYKYNFRVLELQNKAGTIKKDKLIIELEDKSKSLVEDFLMSDIQNDSNPDYVFEAIDQVLSGESEYEELSGNMCLAAISKEKTIIYNKLEGSGRDEFSEIETTELREFVEIWMNEVKRYYKK